MPNHSRHQMLLVVQEKVRGNAAFVALSLTLSRGVVAVARPNTVDKVVRQNTGRSIK